MLTLQEPFSDRILRRNLTPVRVLVIVAGTNTFYLSDRDITLYDDDSNAFTFDSVVSSWGEIYQSLDLQSRESSRGNTQIELSNVPYKRVGADWVRLSDEFFSDDFINCSAKIYMGFDDISYDDFILIFDGVCRPIEDVTTRSLTLPLHEASTAKHLYLPKTEANDVAYTELPQASYGRRLPIVYGTVAIQEGMKGETVEGVWISARKAILADHILNSVEAIWLYDDKLEQIVKIDASSYTITLDDSGKTTVTFDDYDLIAWAYIYPERTSLDYSTIGGYDGISYPERAIDQFANTYLYGKIGTNAATTSGTAYSFFKDLPNAGVITNVYLECKYKCFDPSLQIRGTDVARLLYEGGGTATEMNLMDMYGKASSGTTSQLNDINQNWATDELIGFTVERMDSGELRTIIGNGSTHFHPNTNWTTAPNTNTYYTIFGLFKRTEITTYWNTQTLDWENLSKNVSTGELHFFDLYYTGQTQGADRDYIAIYSYRLLVKYNFGNTGSELYVNMLNGDHRVFAECTGREYGSWITGRGHSAGDLITSPAHIVESMIRDELGITNIDTTLFDAAVTDLAANIGTLLIHEKTFSLDAINEYCRQFHMFCWYATDGQFKIKVHTASPTANDSLDPADIDGEPILQKGDIDKVINKISFEYLYARHLDSYLKTLTSVNTTSQTDYGCINEYKLSCPAISTDAIATSLKDHFTGTSGHWKEIWETLKINMLAWDHIDWEIGDVITLETTFDAILKRFNNGWSGVKFTVTSKGISNFRPSFGLQRIT